MLKRLFTQMIEADISLSEILEKVWGKAGELTALWDSFKAIVDQYLPAVVFALILLGLSLVEVFLGKKILGFQKFIVCFAFGFIVGTAYVQPIIASLIVLDPLIVGAVVGFIAGLLCRPIYFFGYVGVFGYFSYYVIVSGLLLPALLGNKIIGLVVAAVVIALVLVFRKVVEIACTSILGAFLTYLSFDAVVKSVAGAALEDLIGSAELYVKLGVIAVVTVVGFIVQYRTRRRW